MGRWRGWWSSTHPGESIGLSRVIDEAIDDRSSRILGEFPMVWKTEVLALHTDGEWHVPRNGVGNCGDLHLDAREEREPLARLSAAQIWCLIGQTFSSARLSMHMS